MLFQTFPINTVGDDYVVADLHGEYDETIAAMRAVAFDRANDRLFSVGDLVDRGRDNLRCLRFLAQPWVTAVRGNHEDMFLDLYEGVALDDPDQGPDARGIAAATQRNGMGWFQTIAEAERRDCIAAWRAMPVVIEIQTSRGTVGIVHGEVPIGMDWATFRNGIAAGDTDLIKEAVWGRERITRGDTSGVKGIDRVFVGHTPVPGPRRLGNVYYIDTGLVFGKLKDDPTVGRLGFHGLLDATGVVLAPPRPGPDFLDLRAGPDVRDVRFGRYAA